MADDVKSHPPTARRLGKLWTRGVTPASSALVGAVTLTVAAAITIAAWPWLLAQAQAAVSGALVEATHISSAEQAAALARRMMIGAGGIVAGLGLALLVVATVAHQTQLAPRGDTGGGADAPSGDAGGRGAGGVETGWLTLSALVPMVAVLIVGRAALAGAGALPHADPSEALAAGARLAVAVGAPLMAALLGFGLLDVLVKRASFMSAARMSHRELEDELRLTDGHPLTHQRRRTNMRREDDNA